MPSAGDGVAGERAALMMGAASRWRHWIIAAVAVGVFAFSWPFRFNDPGGSFAGLTDDHFFYLIRGWQILFGDLPVRDFVDHGAPLFYYIGAAVQMVLGRGTASELIFCTTALSLGAALTFWLATKASGSIWAGLAGCLVHIWLGPRFYNYPKILVYTAAIPLLWWFASRPGARPRLWVAVVTVVGFLFRHDHGVFVAGAMGALLLFMNSLSWAERVRHGAIYALLVLAFVSPYLAFIQWNGGVFSYMRQASAWADRDRAREPVVWPGLFDNPDGMSDEARDGTGVGKAIAVLRDNRIAWLYYFEIVLPFLALAVLASSEVGFRPDWPEARAKLAMVAVLMAALDAGFLRSPLEARLADTSVPLAILVSWLMIAVPQMIARPAALRPLLRPFRWAVGGAASLVWIPVVLMLAVIVSGDFAERLDKASMTDRFGKMFERAHAIAGQLRLEWELSTWTTQPSRPDLITLSLYINACTAPTDRVLVQSYLPQVLALARRAFAGGHADLRPGFFETEEAQRLTVERLQRQSVPIILLDTDKSLDNFRESFPLVMGHIDAQYDATATHEFDRRFGLTLFTRRELKPTSVWEPLGWPCYGGGTVKTELGAVRRQAS
jgi:hypothetical protein